jgi:hypothetical protein
MTWAGGGHGSPPLGPGRWTLGRQRGRGGVADWQGPQAARRPGNPPRQLPAASRWPGGEPCGPASWRVRSPAPGLPPDRHSIPRRTNRRRANSATSDSSPNRPAPASPRRGPRRRPAARSSASKAARAIRVPTGSATGAPSRPTCRPVWATASAMSRLWLMVARSVCSSMTCPHRRVVWRVAVCHV